MATVEQTGLPVSSLPSTEQLAGKERDISCRVSPARHVTVSGVAV